MVMAKSAFVFCLMLVAASVSAIPLPTDETGLNAALSSIAHSVVVVSEDEPQHNVSSTVQADEPAPVKLESANVLPSLALIAITPEAHNVLAETEKLVYENETDSKGVIKITVVTPTTVHDEDDSGEQSTTEASEGTTLAVEDTTQVTDSETEVTTDITSTEVTSHSTTVSHELTVLGIDQADKQKEEEIKKTIKEVEAMPVILTAGV